MTFISKETKIFSEILLFFGYLCIHFESIRIKSKLTYVTTKEMTKKGFTINSQKINKKNGIDVIFMLEMKLQNYIFFSKIWPFLGAIVSLFEPLLG